LVDEYKELINKVTLATTKRGRSEKPGRLNETFRAFSVAAANTMGTSWMFFVNLVLILIWVVAGPFFNYSDSWQLVVNTGTTVLTYLAVFLIQNTQNRDAKAIHLKLDELIKGVEGARTHLVNLENLTGDELDKLQKEFERLRKSKATPRVANMKTGKPTAV
jgi:low affinity Fe/Cu permease